MSRSSGLTHRSKGAHQASASSASSSGNHATLVNVKDKGLQVDEGEQMKGHPSDEDEDQRVVYAVATAPFTLEQSAKDLLICLGIFLLAASLRFYRIDHPDSVVFDEVHFGKFASFYLRREYFFDVHPPLAKMMLALAGWLIGYEGHFEFENIGDDYVSNKVPYIGLRSLPALCGSLYCPILYAIMRESGFPRIVAFFSAMLVTFDNSHITHSRLILLDAQLLLFMACSIYCYVRFYKARHVPFTQPWWNWLHATGVFLALTLACKMNGLLTFMMIGSAVCIDLWNLLDDKRKPRISDRQYARHFAARAWALIAVPIIVYLACFYIHFAILVRSGTGDDFMSPAFQETLQDSPLSLTAQEIRYYDKVMIQHKQTKGYLHSHVERYPLRYDDGRISSAGQQVTCYPFNDTNNVWEILPTQDFAEDQDPRAQSVRHSDVVQLRHVNTQTILLTHDVASPLMATNTEFTTVKESDAAEKRYNETLFRFDIMDAHAGQHMFSKSSYFKVIHLGTSVAMWSHPEPVLPDWAFKQQEVNGNKNTMDKTNTWVISDIVKEPGAEESEAPRTAPSNPKQVKKRGFLKKFWELQTLMLHHNAGLTDSHPYATGPGQWPFLISGISFWTGKPETREQVYMVGNVVAWLATTAALCLFGGMLGAEAIARHRGWKAFDARILHRIYTSPAFFLMGWAWHYFPFFLMNRQLFLHHYLPAHLLAALIAGATLNILCSESINGPLSIPGASMRRQPRLMATVNFAMLVSISALLIGTVASFVFLAPLTYGTPGLSVEAVQRRRVLESWTLHFAK